MPLTRYGLSLFLFLIRNVQYSMNGAHITDRNMIYWKLTGIVATVVIVLSFPAYLMKERSDKSFERNLPVDTRPAFVGSLKCKDCHKNEFDKWTGSHHDHAMHVADESQNGKFTDMWYGMTCYLHQERRFQMELRAIIFFVVIAIVLGIVLFLNWSSVKHAFNRKKER